MKKNLRIWGICCIVLVLLLSASFTYAAKKSSQDNIEVAQKLLKIKKSRKKGIKRLAILAKLAKKDDFASSYIGHQAISILAKEYRSPSNIFIPAKGKLPKYDTDVISQKNTSVEKALKLVKDYNDFSIIRNCNPSEPDKEYCNPKLLPFLELSHCKAINLEVNESFKMVNYAETNTKGLDKCRTLFKFAEILYDVGEATDSIDNLERAKRYLSDCLQYGNDFFQPLKISETGKTKNKSGYAEWQSIKKQIPGFELEIDFALLAKELGPGYADLVRMKTHFADEDWFLAYPLAEKIMIKYPSTIYSTEARLYRCRMLLMNDTAGEYRDKDVPSGVKEMKKFIEDRPYGNLRGEAWLDLANHYLTYKWDSKQASYYYKNALDWFRKIRTMKDNIDLFAKSAKNGDVARQKKILSHSAPMGKNWFIDPWNRMNYRNSNPKEIINRKTAPLWYINEKEKEALFMVGFFLFMEEKFDEAKKCFIQITSVDNDIAMLEKKRIPNAIMRLRGACKQGFLAGMPAEMKPFKGKNRLKIMFADLQFVISHFKSAEKMYNSIYEDEANRNKPGVKAYALIGVANSIWMQRDQEKAYQISERVYREYPNVRPVAAHALMNCGYLASYANDMELNKKAYKIFYKCYKKYLDTTYGESALFRVALNYSFSDISKARKYMREYNRTYPKGKYKKALIKYIVNKNKSGEKNAETEK